ncbi:MAG TPA: right-handed parallel beta-helix repeat-containing protein [Kofleriaceae bacterium]|nr:right-handed parallel beta-helix repeat-containing protein [Kofleriaceae bacterium]
MIAVLLLAAGCGRQLNPVFCDEHPNDPDCRNSGLVQIDAPMGECTQSAMCTGNPNGPVCDTGSQTCVQCIVGIDVSGCAGGTPQCGDDHLCHGCVFDTHCSASNVCLPNGMCADETAVLYAAPTGTGTVCSQAAPCTFTTAVAAVTATKHIVKLLPSATPYSEPPITIDNTQPMQILADSAIFDPTGTGDGLTVTATNVEIVGLTVKSATGDGVACSGTSILSMRQMNVTDNTGYGINSSGCTITIERSRFSRNVAGGMLLVAGKLEVRNNIIDHGGNAALDKGNVTIQNGNGRFVFNTIANNLSKGGGGRIGGIDCSPTSGLTMQVARNILADNGAGKPLGGTCTTGTTNYVGKVADIKFSDAANYKLGPMTPTTILRDDPESVADCMTGTKYIDDYEGETRPVNYCDRGADEFHAPP